MSAAPPSITAPWRRQAEGGPGGRLVDALRMVPLPGRPSRHLSSAARRRVMRRRRLARTLVMMAGIAALVAWLAASGGGVAAPAQVRVRVTLPHLATPSPPTTAATLAAGAPAPALPWPKTGQAAVDIPAVGYSTRFGAQQPVPVASMTKVMTAYVVLEDHPLALGQQGPRVPITDADVEDFDTDTVTDQANVELKTGEVLTEYQMLEGLLVHSANDFAYALASWDAGSVPKFVAKMNAAAAALGMTHTHFADASGYSPSSKSTAGDILKVAAAAMADPVFAQIVKMPAATFPYAGSVGSYTPLIGTPGVVGVKSGFTDAAGGGDILAYDAQVGGHPVLVLAAVTSQQGWTVLVAAGKAALSLAQAAAARVLAATVAPSGTVVGRVAAGGRSVPVKTAAPASVLYMAGDTVHQTVHLRAPRAGARKGTNVGTATFTLAGQRVSVPVDTAARVP